MQALAFFMLIGVVMVSLVSATSVTSWVESANDSQSDFPIENLPYGVFSTQNAPTDRRIGIAIGDYVLDVRGCVEQGLIHLSPQVDAALKQPQLNALMALGQYTWREVRQSVQNLLLSDREILRDDTTLRNLLLIPMGQIELHLPAVVGDYSDFYTSLEHATNVGKLFRPDAPLPPNFKHLPLGYHGRASSVVVSGTPVQRPWGQTRDGQENLYEPCQRLDYEMELAAFIGPGNELGGPIPVSSAGQHLFGVVILNDWSARDVQKWEYVPLGPFNAKNFATSISPWVVSLEALEPYRIAGVVRAVGDPEPLPYLQPVENFAFDVVVEVYLASRAMREEGITPTLISRGNFATMYWTFAQMLAQHTSTGCNMRSGDLIGSGTISGPTRDSRGCLLEFCLPDGAPITLADGSTRTFLLDGDEVILKAYAQREGLPRIGFGECRGTVLPARQEVTIETVSPMRRNEISES